MEVCSPLHTLRCSDLESRPVSPPEAVDPGVVALCDLGDSVLSLMLQINIGPPQHCLYERFGAFAAVSATLSTGTHGTFVQTLLRMSKPVGSCHVKRPRMMALIPM